MTERAIFYACSAGYLLQTVTSALQARALLSTSDDIVVLHFSADDGRSDEYDAFARVTDAAGVELRRARLEPEYLTPFGYARLWADDHLPKDAERLLYLDGDTQVVADLAPLLYADPPEGGVLAAPDPLNITRVASAAFARRIEGWLDAARIPAAGQIGYVNSGVLRIDRPVLARLSALAKTDPRVDAEGARFSDQDFVNRTLQGAIRTASLDWNFPGFLLGTQFEREFAPKVIHFMSEPGPWEAPYAPWGKRYFEPYQRLVAQHPHLQRYWHRAGPIRRARYTAQQAYKGAVEGRLWNSSRAMSVEPMLRGDLVLG